MHPSLFRDVWGLTYVQLAEVLPRSEETLRRYGFRKSARKHLEPSPDICWIARSVHEKWLSEGRQPVRPWLISQDAVIAA